MSRGQEVSWKLKADPSGFSSAAQSARAELASIGKLAAGMGATFAAVGGAAAAGLLLITRNAVEAGGKLADLQAKTGASTDFLQKLGHAAKLGGSDIEAAAKAINVFQKNVSAGGAEGAKVFAQLGLSASALRKELPETAFLQTAEAIRNLKNPTDQAAAAMAVFGKAGADLLPAIKAGLGEAADEAERLGLVMSRETVAAADALGDSVDTLTATWTGFQNQLASTVIESASVHALIGGLTSALGDLSGAAKNNKATLRDLVDAGILKVVDGLMLMVRAIGVASDAWGTIRILWLSSIGLATDLSIAMAKASRAMPWTSKEAKRGYTEDIALMTAYKAGLADEATVENAAMGDRKTAVAALEKQFQGLRAAVAAAAGKNVEFGASAAGAAGNVDLLSGKIATLTERMKAAVAAGNPFAGVLGDTRNDASKVNDYLGGLPGASNSMGTSPGAGNPYDPGPAPAVGMSWGQQFTLGFENGIKQLPGVIIGAIQGGGDVGKAIGATIGGSVGSSLAAKAGPALGKMLGGTIGGAVGSVIPVVGTLIGGFLGSAIGGLFGGGAKKKAEAEAKRKADEDERRRIGEAARETRARGVEGLMTTAPAYFAARTITTPDDAKRQGTLFAAAWGTVVKEKGIVAAAAAFGDAFDKMKADIEAAGIEPPAWMKAVGGQMALGKDDAFIALADAARTAAEFLKALGDSGALDAEGLKAFEQDARAAFEGGKARAIDLGQGEEAATKAGFAAANPLLKELLNQSVVSGQTLSADIQALIEQAGIVPSIDVQKLQELQKIRAAVESLADIPSAAGGKRIEREGLVYAHPRETIVPDSQAVVFAESVIGRSGGQGTNAGSARLAESAILSELRTMRQEQARVPHVTVPLTVDTTGLPRYAHEQFIEDTVQRVERVITRPGGPVHRMMRNMAESEAQRRTRR